MADNLKELIIKRKIGMAEHSLLNDAEVVINQILYRLDLEQHRMELKWGVGRLVELAPPDLRAKWSNQAVKLNEAVLAGNVPLVEELVVGSCRGWVALQRSAEAAGHVPFEPMVMEVPVEGFIYQVVRTNEDAAALASRSSVEKPVVTLEELARVYHLKHSEVFQKAYDGCSDKGEYVPSGRPMDEAIPF